MAEIYFFMVLCALTLLADDVYSECKLPEKVRGTWYSYEKGNNTYTNITKAGMSINQGDMIPCVDLEKINNNDYLAIFKNGSCYSCMQIFVRHLNIVQKHVGPCKTLAEGETASTDTLCDKSGAYVKLDTLFYQDRTGADSARTAVSCKPYLEGAWRYRYARPLKFTRICDAPGSTLHACQSPDEHHKNVKFHVNMKTCRGYPHSYELDDDFACIGGWYIGKQLFFAIYNTKDASDDQKYRCLAKYPQNHTILGMSDIPDCNELAYINDPAEVFFLTPLQTEPIPSYCTLPEAFVGEYLDTANAYADVTINYTHIVETEEIDGIEKTVVYSCQELRGDTVVVARKTVEGCGPDYVCIQFLHNDTNVIRYNKGEPTSAREYEKVCGSPRKDSGRFEYFVKKTSNPVTCPFQGRYKFTQVGNYPLKKRIIENVGITLPPLPGTSCKETISNFEVTNSTENKISITLDYCVRVDGSGKPVLNFQDPDLEVRCISNWQENNNSYVITYDQFITPRVYYCWLYENINENQIRITLSERACYKNQTSVNSYGAEVALELQKYEYGQ